MSESVKRAGVRRRLRMPMRLSTRVQLTMAIASALVFSVIASIVGVGITQYSRTLAASDAANRLSVARLQLEVAARDLGSELADLTHSPAATGTPDPALAESLVATWRGVHVERTSLVWIDPGGGILASRGAQTDVTALADLATRSPEGTTGTLSLPGGPAIVAIRPVPEDGSPSAWGTIAVARPIESIGIPALPDGVIFLPPGTAESLDEEPGGGGAPAGFGKMLTTATDGLLVTTARITGVDGAPSVTVRLQRPDPGLACGRLWLVILVPVALGLVTVGLGYLLGMMVGRSVTRPLHRFVTYLQDQGYLALQGLRTDEELEIEPGLPRDFAELGTVIVDLMTQLRINQAEILEANDQALAAERAFRTVVEESPEVKILVRGGIVEIANPAAAHFFGLGLGDLLRATPGGLFAGVQFFDERDAQVDFVSVAREAGGQPRVVRCVADEQPDRWMEISVAFIDPTLDDYVISARNITEERRLEALRSEVLSLVSHDLRSPLTVVRGYLDILEKPIPEAQRETAVGNARRATQRMEGLLDDLLYATRAERVLAPRVMRPIDLVALVTGVASSLQIGAPQTIVIDAEPGVTVLGDSARLEQAITNLIGNAIKHGPVEGEVRVGIASHGLHARVTIEDDGPGIPEDERERLFQRGMRGASTAPGMGLGLYIVRVVAEAHGGQAVVEPTEHGTRFVLDLPVAAVGEDAS